MQPLLVTSLGRMGTTLLMKLLAAHPAVVTYERPPFEARGGKYWTHVLQVMSAPADASKRIGAPMEFHSEPKAVGANPFFSSEFAAWPEVEIWEGGDYLASLATFCQRSIDGWYLATASAQGKDAAPLRFFAEKHFPDAYPRRLRELYAQPAELFLVRDFRDMFTSMRAYNARKGYGDFGRAAAADDQAWITTLRQGLQALLEAWRERGSPASLVRYEELVQQPEVALPPVLDALGLDVLPSHHRPHGRGRFARCAGPAGAWHHGQPGRLHWPLASRLATGSAGPRQHRVPRPAERLRLRPRLTPSRTRSAPLPSDRGHAPLPILRLG